MPRITWDKLRGGSCFEFSLPGWGRTKKQLQYSDIVAIDMAVVTYGGMGKYIQGLDFAYAWEKLPEELSPEDRLADVSQSTRGFWPTCWTQ